MTSTPFCLPGAGLQSCRVRPSQLRPPASLAECEQPQYPTDREEEIGLFLFISEEKSGCTAYWRSGGEAGVLTRIIYNTTGAGVILVCSAKQAEA
ncbi:MAG: hypothetical protein JXA13_10085 [Anaerolineales bacterium]|nr:hypothetical protein [Anaerolineales bacterium]